MATHHGKDGVVKVGANAVAEVTQFSVKVAAQTADDTAMGDSWKSHISGKTINSWSGSLTCHWDETDTQGQEALTIGASVTLGLYPEGGASGATYLSGTATITGINYTVSKDNVVERAFDFEGNGALTQSTVAP